MKITMNILLSALLLACCSSDSLPTEAASSESRIETVQLAPDQTVSLAAHRGSITFESVVSDSRCPTDVVCVTAGEAVVRLKLVTPSGPNSFQLSSTPARSTTIEGISFEVVLVKPDPVSTVQTKPSDYRVTLRVSY